MAQVPQNLKLPQGPLRESDVIESTPIVVGDEAPNPQVLLALLFCWASGLDLLDRDGVSRALILRSRA